MVKPIGLIGGTPSAFGKSVTPLFFTESSQDLRVLGCDPAFAGSVNKCFL
jgi:hypothetical protein